MVCSLMFPEKHIEKETYYKKVDCTIMKAGKFKTSGVGGRLGIQERRGGG